VRRARPEFRDQPERRARPGCRARSGRPAQSELRVQRDPLALPVRLAQSV
jgi:hypothetical protein